MKQLPQYFVIKQEVWNPLWNKYLKWLAKTYDTTYNFYTYDYVGYDGCSSHNGVHGMGSLSSRYNKAELITLEQWDEIVNPKTILDLSNTKIKVNSPEESTLVQKKAFELGWSWTGGETKVKYTNVPYLYFGAAKGMSYGAEFSTFINSSEKEITLKDLEIEIKPTLQPMNYKITPGQAQSIINIACATWKAKLATLWANKIVLNEEITIEESFYKEMRKACTEQQHRLFDKIFGPEKKEFNCQMLQQGEAMIVEGGMYNGEVIIKFHEGFISTKDFSTWNNDAILKGRKVKLNPITYKEI